MTCDGTYMAFVVPDDFCDNFASTPEPFLFNSQYTVIKITDREQLSSDYISL